LRGSQIQRIGRIIVSKIIIEIVHDALPPHSFGYVSSSRNKASYEIPIATTPPRSGPFLDDLMPSEAVSHTRFIIEHLNPRDSKRFGIGV
jgi:hypothetical protein